MRKRKMHLAQFLCHGPTYHSLAMWRHPRTAEAGFDWARPELYQHIARVCERGKFDMVFFADLNYISDTYRGTMDPAIRHATQAPEHDPIPLLSFMAAVTTHIGLGATFSISHSHPFYAARLWATLDHLTRGRAAWNVVTSLNHNQSANYGEERRPTDERYDRAHEFIEVCRKLWDSWDPDAVVMDRAAGVFADPSKVHRIELKSGTVNEGRAPEACKILFGIQPILGATEDEARAKQARHNRLVPLEGGMAILSGHLDFDLSTLPLDEAMAGRTEPQLQRMQTRYRTLTGELLTLREVAQRHGQSVGLVQLVGTPSQVADQMEDYFDQVGGDGFMLSPIYSPGAIEEFVDLVVPELQRRGRYRRDYVGTTQRDHLMQEE